MFLCTSQIFERSWSWFEVKPEELLVGKIRPCPVLAVLLSSTTTTMSNESKIRSFPPEILLHIFVLAADNYDPKREPSIDIGNRSPWSQDLQVRVKKADVRVCRMWRA